MEGTAQLYIVLWLISSSTPTYISEWSGEPALQPQTFDHITASCTGSFPGSPSRITALLLLNRSLAIHSTSCGTHGDPWVAGGKLPLQLPLPLLDGVGEGEEVEKNQGRHGWTGGKDVTDEDGKL